MKRTENDDRKSCIGTISFKMIHLLVKQKMNKSQVCFDGSPSNKSGLELLYDTANLRVIEET